MDVRAYKVVGQVFRHGMTTYVKPTKTRKQSIERGNLVRIHKYTLSIIKFGLFLSRMMISKLENPHPSIKKISSSYDSKA